MPGLLDLFDNGDAQLGLGLLAAAAPRADGAGFGQRLMEGVQSAQQWKQQKQKDAYMQTLMDAQKSEIEQRKLKAQQEQMSLDIAARKQAALPTLFTGGQQALAPLAGDSSIGILPSVGRPAVAPRLDVQRALASGYTPDEIQKLDALRNVGQNKVARTIKGIGPDGKEYEYQVDEMGNKVGDVFAQYKAPLMQDLGGNVSALDPYTLTPKANFPKTMTFGDKAAMGNLSVSQQRLKMEQDNQTQPKYNNDLGGFVAPPDKANPNGRFIPLPGGTTGGTLNDNQSKALLFGSRMQEADKVLGKLAKQGVDQPGYIKRIAEGTGGVVPFVGQGLGNAMGAATNWTQSDEQQQVEQAQRDFVNAVLRKESGAAISPSEFDNAKKQYFDQPGDGQAVKAQKAANRQLAISGMLAEVPQQKRSLIAPQSPKLPGMNLPMDFGSNDPLGLFGKR